MTDEQFEVLQDIIENTERPDKITVSLDKATRTMTIVYESLDEEWFKEMVAAST